MRDVPRGFAKTFYLDHGASGNRFLKEKRCKTLKLNCKDHMFNSALCALKMLFLSVSVIALMNCSSGSSQSSDSNLPSSSTSSSSSSSTGSPSPSIASSSSSGTGSVNKPNGFSFSPRMDVELNQMIVSDAITVTGISSSIEISIVGGGYSLDGGATFTTEASIVDPGQEVMVRLTSSQNPKQTTQATLDMGGVKGTYSVTTGDLNDDIDFSKFEDPALRECVRSTGITNISMLLGLSCNFSNIGDSAGIEQLTALTSLNLSFNELDSIDLSSNRSLTLISLIDNRLTTIDVSLITALEELYLGENRLTQIDLSENVDLTELHIQSNELATLDISMNSDLKKLDASQNKLVAIDVWANKRLTELYLDYNQLADIDVSMNTNLINLILGNNELDTIDLSVNADLDWLSIDNNHLTEIDISQNDSLTRLSVDSNKLINIDISSNGLLRELYIQNNLIPCLNLQDIIARFETVGSSDCIPESDSSNENPAEDISSVPSEVIVISKDIISEGFTIEWTESTVEGDQGVTYNVSLDDTVVASDLASLSYTFEDLTVDTTHNVTVTAISNEFGTSSTQGIEVVTLSGPVPNDFTIDVASVGPGSATIHWTSLTIDGDGSVLADLYVNGNKVVAGLTASGHLLAALEPDSEYQVKVIARSSAYGTTLEEEITFRTEVIPTTFEVSSATVYPRSTDTFDIPPTVIVRISKRQLLDSIMLGSAAYSTYTYAGDDGIYFSISDDKFSELNNASVKEGTAIYTESGVTASVTFKYVVE